MKVYIDTSVINGLLAEDAPEIQEKTKLFFQRVKKGEFQVYVSGFVINELEATPDEERKQKLLQILDSYPFKELEATDKVVKLAEEYLKRKIIPAKSRMDGLHIAIAAIHKIEVLVSWNFKHIVKHKTRIETNLINEKKGYGQVDLCSPEEV